MSLGKGIRLKMNREAIIANLRGIWEALCQGDQIESQIGSFILLGLNKLESYWGIIQRVSISAIQDPIEQDEIEYFLNHIANFD